MSLKIHTTNNPTYSVLDTKAPVIHTIPSYPVYSTAYHEKKRKDFLYFLKKVNKAFYPFVFYFVNIRNCFQTFFFCFEFLFSAALFCCMPREKLKDNWIFLFSYALFSRNALLFYFKLLFMLKAINNLNCFFFNKLEATEKKFSWFYEIYDLVWERKKSVNSFWYMKKHVFYQISFCKSIRKLTFKLCHVYKLNLINCTYPLDEPYWPWAKTGFKFRGNSKD